MSGMLKFALDQPLSQAVERAARKHGGLNATALREAVDEVLGPPAPERMYVERKEPPVPRRCFSIESDDQRDRLLAEHAAEKLIEILIPDHDEEMYRRYVAMVGSPAEAAGLSEAPAGHRWLVDATTAGELEKQYPHVHAEMVAREQEAQREAEEGAALRRWLEQTGDQRELEQLDRATGKAA